MNVYAYNGELFCESCGRSRRREVPRPLYPPPWDSNEYPQGTLPHGGGEADFPQHCAECHRFLENPLTVDGMRFLADRVTHAPDNPVTQQWAAYYDVA